jgi:hypothetical protein
MGFQMDIGGGRHDEAKLARPAVPRKRFGDTGRLT